MLAIHWSPVKNTKRILRSGIRANKGRVFCFPLTGHDTVDRWWVRLFQHSKTCSIGQYNGFVFRVTEEDLPAQFSDWIVDAIGQAKWFESLPELESEFRKMLLFRIGETYNRMPESTVDLESLGEKLVREDPMLHSRFTQDPEWMNWVFSDYQIVLSGSVSAKRIIRTVAGSQQSGRQRVRKFRESIDDDL